MTDISIFGLGYVGAVSMACLADVGHRVVGVDVSAAKVDMINRGQSPILETGLPDLIARAVASGQIRATTDAVEAVLATDLSIISVGTPGAPNGSLNLTFIRRVCEDIGQALAGKDAPHTVVVRSTMLPGSTEELVIPALEASSGKSVGHDIRVVYHPEFLREGSSIQDFYDPPVTVMGGTDESAIAAALAIYPPMQAPFMAVPYKVAELVKYANNAFHGLKVTFANEIGNLCKRQGIDGHEVMNILCQDRKLNISPMYMKPGFAFGGSCLPKDLRALLYHSRNFDLTLPVLESILPSNQHQIDIAYQMIKRSGRKRIGVLGMSFKPGTDDLRESPMVELIEYLLGKGYTVRVYDRQVALSNLQGANREYIEREIPHVATLMADSLEEVLAGSDVIVAAHRSPEFADLLGMLRDDQLLIDLVRLTPEVPDEPRYEGICW